MGDLDSISPAAREAFSGRLIELPAQDKGDLEKTILWVAAQFEGEVTLLGASGAREDFTFTSIAMLWTDFGLPLRIVTDTGLFSAHRGHGLFQAHEGQPVALLPSNLTVLITTHGLAYELSGETLPSMHGGISNRAMGAQFEVSASAGSVIVYQGHRP